MWDSPSTPEKRLPILSSLEGFRIREESFYVRKLIPVAFCGVQQNPHDIGIHDRAGESAFLPGADRRSYRPDRDVERGIFTPRSMRPRTFGRSSFTRQVGAKASRMLPAASRRIDEENLPVSHKRYAWFRRLSRPAARPRLQPLRCE